MNRAQALTKWSVSREPQIALDYFGGLMVCDDATAQPNANITPDPNLYIVQIECDDAVLTAIEADANYFVLWDEPIIEELP